jgi:hypothetical protein
MNCKIKTLDSGKLMLKKLLICCLAIPACSMARSESLALPQNVVEQLPRGYAVMTMQASDLNNDQLTDYIVVVHKEDEGEIAQREGKAPRRPLLIFTQNPNKTFTLSARNDYVVFAVDEGGQCDPFLDSGDGIAVKGTYFTVENEVACGAHWTDYITFKYSEKLRNWVFHKRIYENWILNDSRKPNADALVLGSRKVTPSKKDSLTLLQDYRP